MKKALLIFVLSLFCGISNSQNVVCGDEFFSKIEPNTSESEKKKRELNLRLKQYIDAHYNDQPNLQNRPSSGNTPNNYLIPVVFHIVHNGENYGVGTNITYAQIQSQIAALNAAFAKNYPAYNGQSHPSYAQNTNIQFCLARTAAPSSVNFFSGSQGVEWGVMRYNNTTSSNHALSTTGATNLMNLTHPSPNYFPFDSYFNIWVVTNIVTGSPGTVAGYAPTPIMSPFPLDGVVIRSDVTGDNTVTNSFSLGLNLEQGKVLVHEIGHYLNLRHIFEGGCSGTNGPGSTSDACDLNGDYICDTEPSNMQNFNCGQQIPNTCTANYAAGTTTLDMIESYMSYADDNCQNTFTSGQRNRMWATLQLQRHTLWQYANLGKTGIMGNNGCLTTTLYTDIVANATSACVNLPVTLQNSQAGNAATSWTWSSPGGSFSSPNSSTSTIMFSTAGLHKVMLTASNGTSTIKDSILISVISCSLDPLLLNRSNWFIGSYSTIDFSTGQPVPTNVALVNNSIHCAEVSVSMSDSSGGLLFYSNGYKLWDNTHTLVGTPPLLSFNILQAQSSAIPGSVSGFMSAPLPKRPGKYLIISIPPVEVRSSSTQSAVAKISYVIYDVVSKTVTPAQVLNHPSINYVYPYTVNTGISESLGLVPHCNGTDLWVVTRGVNTSGSQVFYSFLVTENGLASNTPPVISGPHSFSFYSQFSDIKFNKAGNKFVCKADDKTKGAIYDFNQMTGVVSNPIMLPGSGTLNTQPFVHNGIIFSPDDQHIYNATQGGVDMIQVSSNTLIKTIQYSPSIISAQGAYFEIGPDNNIYHNAVTSGGWVYVKLINPNSATSSTFASNVTFTSVTGTSPLNGIVNFMRTPYPLPVDPISKLTVSCSAFNFSLNPCWQLYTPSWNFGDGSPAASGNNVSHTYLNNGIYTVSLTLTYNGQTMPVITRTVQSLNSIAISGPSVVCKGSTYLNSYGTSVIAGAGYTWTVANASIAGLSNLANISVGATNTGVSSLTVQVQAGVCLASATKTFQVQDPPVVTLQTPKSTICVGEAVVMNGSPVGGSILGGIGGNTFVPVSPGTQTITYVYANAAGCSNSATVSILATTCVDLNELNDGSTKIYPNPTQRKLFIDNYHRFERYKIIDLAGRICMEGKTINEIDVSQLDAGVYQLELKELNGKQLKLRFVKEAE